MQQSTGNAPAEPNQFMLALVSARQSLTPNPQDGNQSAAPPGQQHAELASLEGCTAVPPTKTDDTAIIALPSMQRAADDGALIRSPTSTRDDQRTQPRVSLTGANVETTPTASIETQRTDRAPNSTEIAASPAGGIHSASGNKAEQKAVDWGRPIGGAAIESQTHLEGAMNDGVPSPPNTVLSAAATPEALGHAVITLTTMKPSGRTPRGDLAAARDPVAQPTASPAGTSAPLAPAVAPVLPQVVPAPVTDVRAASPPTAPRPRAEGTVPERTLPDMPVTDKTSQNLPSAPAIPTTNTVMVRVQSTAPAASAQEEADPGSAPPPTSEEPVAAVGSGRRADNTVAKADLHVHANAGADVDAATTEQPTTQQDQNATGDTGATQWPAAVAAPFGMSGLQAPTTATSDLVFGGSAAPVSNLTPAHQVAPALLSLGASVDGGQQLTLKLQPEELGTVVVRIDQRVDGTAHISVTADSPATLQLLAAEQADLHRALDAAGIPVTGRTLNLALTAAADTSPAGIGMAAGWVPLRAPSQSGEETGGRDPASGAGGSGAGQSEAGDPGAGRTGYSQSGGGGSLTGGTTENPRHQDPRVAFAQAFGLSLSTATNTPSFQQG